MRHEKEAGRTGAVRKHLHSSDSHAQATSVNEVPILRVGHCGETAGGQTVGLHLVAQVEERPSDSMVLVPTHSFDAGHVKLSRGRNVTVGLRKYTGS